MGVDAIMKIDTDQSVNTLEVSKWLYARIGAPLRPNRFGPISEWHHCVTLDKYKEHTLEVHLSCRYYGMSYERGPLLDILRVADWVHLAIPDALIYYGGDHEESIPILDEPRRNVLLRHFFEVENAPYYLPSIEQDDGVIMPDCPLCKAPIWRHGWGRGYAKGSCNTCAWSTETRDGGGTWND